MQNPLSQAKSNHLRQPNENEQLRGLQDSLSNKRSVKPTWVQFDHISAEKNAVNVVCHLHEANCKSASNGFDLIFTQKPNIICFPFVKSGNTIFRHKCIVAVNE